MISGEVNAYALNAPLDKYRLEPPVPGCFKAKVTKTCDDETWTRHVMVVSLCFSSQSSKRDSQRNSLQLCWVVHSVNVQRKNCMRRQKYSSWIHHYPLLGPTYLRKILRTLPSGVYQKIGSDMWTTLLLYYQSKYAIHRINEEIQFTLEKENENGELPLKTFT